MSDTPGGGRYRPNFRWWQVVAVAIASVELTICGSLWYAAHFVS